MNPLSIIQMMKSGNPQQFMQQIRGNRQIMSNPMMKNTMQIEQNGDMKGVEQMARSICKEKGLDADEMFNNIKKRFDR